MRQQHLQTQRQAAYRENLGQQQQLKAIYDAEQADSQRSCLTEQQGELLAKLPAWKDPAKATAEKAALKSYLIGQGFNEQNIDNIQDHKAVVLGRKAMLYDAMMAKANAAVKKVTAAPQRVIKSGIGEAHVNDPAQAAKNRLAKTGRMERADAVSMFSNFV